MNLATAVAALTGWATPRAEDSESSGMRHSRGVADTLTAQAVHLAGWPTASARDWKDSEGMATTGTNPDGSERTRLDQLPRVATLAGWPTPMAGTPAQNGNNEAGNTDSSRLTVALSGWPTPCARDSFPAHSEEYIAEKKALGHGMANLNDVVQFLTQNPQPARLTARGEMLIGSTAGMSGGGQLRPAHSRWLMGFPVEWDIVAIYLALTAPKKKRSASPSKKSASRSVIEHQREHPDCAVTATPSTRGKRRTSSK